MAPSSQMIQGPWRQHDLARPLTVSTLKPSVGMVVTIDCSFIRYLHTLWSASRYAVFEGRDRC
jgi:hypothetical protein